MGQHAADVGGRDARAITRRQALTGGGALVVGAGTGVLVAGCGEEHRAPSYPRATITKLSSVHPHQPITFGYPLRDQASVLIDLDQAVPRGVGPKQSIVAYSALCQHMGCPVAYQPALGELVCPCHQTRYDPGRLGSIIQGVAMLPLPRVQLEVSNGMVQATGVDGLIYGYRSNLHPGKRV